jgi:hypothetical protein
MNRRAVHRENDVAFLQPGGRGRHIGLHLVDDRSLRRDDHRLAHTLAPPPARFGLEWLHLEIQNLAIPFHLEWNRGAFAAHHVPDDAVVHPGEAGHPVAIHLEDFVARQNARTRCRRILRHVTDDCGGVGFAHRVTDHPDDAREKEREQKTEERPRDRNDDFVQRGNGRELRAIGLDLALDDVHGRELRHRHKPAERQRAERVLHAVDGLLPDRLPEPDAELLHDKPAPPRCEEMSQLMHDDEQVKEDEDLEDNKGDA